ncbi:MAG TPA: prepilin-type N-terminal cleavage/methylation domain-containing protein [Myxococcota bacterium]|nr:prepilin-type N-terminal cleavage/methylation domain-containing protein [Myxococcota bacterium]
MGDRDMMRRREGFTLIELMIVVAIIGILAAIAIPNFLKFQLRSKTGEAKANLAAIRTAEEGYFSEYSVYVAQIAAWPTALPNNLKQVWAVGSGFDQLGWSPEGEVFFMYGVNWPGPGATAGAFTAAAEGDLDADTTFSQFGYVHPAGTTAASAVPAPFGPCPAAGTYDAGTAVNDLLNTVGPCRATDGQSVF